MLCPKIINSGKRRHLPTRFCIMTLDNYLVDSTSHEVLNFLGVNMVQIVILAP